jgi:hypothetical protein
MDDTLKLAKILLLGALIGTVWLIPSIKPSETAAIREDLCVEMRGVPEFNWWGYFSGCRWPGRDGGGR